MSKPHKFDERCIGCAWQTHQWCTVDTKWKEYRRLKVCTLDTKKFGGPMPKKDLRELLQEAYDLLTKRENFLLEQVRRCDEIEAKAEALLARGDATPEEVRAIEAEMKELINGA